MVREATIVWFQQDLRLRDNPALDAAARRGGPVIPVYVWCPEEEGAWPPGAASRWWLHRSLQALDASLAGRGLRLALRTGATLECLRELAAETGATAVLWNRRYEPAAIARSAAVKAGLRALGLAAASFNAALLAEPWEWLNRAGKPYQVYTPFARRLLHDLDPPQPLPIPRTLRAAASAPRSVPLEALGLLPALPWYETMAAQWQPGEAGAWKRLKRFLAQALGDYARARDLPAVAGTSRLSPHLHFGEIGPRQIWHALGPRGRSSPFLRELLWREFAHHLLYHFPHTATEPLRGEFARFPWRTDGRLLRAWQRGRTGVPLVDAGMRELWAHGWMHNRVRMVAGSFLVKNLLLPWQTGACWFWDTLVDADLAANTLNWQWVAGCGADAAPYFRIFNPLAQAQRFDAQGEYVRRWVPEASSGGRPGWGAAPAGGAPGAPYPAPIVDLRASREAALEAYATMRRAAR